MSKKCQICEKKPVMESGRKKLMSMYNPTPKKKKQPNLQKTFVPLNVSKEGFKKFAGKKIVACTKCIKTLSKEK